MWDILSAGAALVRFCIYGFMNVMLFESVGKDVVVRDVYKCGKEIMLCMCGRGN